MSYFPEMEWSTKWDWENFVASKKPQLADWTMVDDGEIDTESFNLLGVGSSVRSPISASTDSSTKNGIQTPNLRFITFEGSSGKVSKNVETKDTEVSEISQPLKPSVGSMEPLIGLKLGKRTYFENGGTAGYAKSSSLSVRPIPSTTTPKKMKFSARNAPIPFCQVEGCNIDLSASKEYHRKHRVCDTHSKCPKVIVGGLERRFCQQCSRFHSLLDFDEKKRSCRSRLSGHNARRRKPQMKHIHFDSTNLSSPFFAGTQQMSSLLNNSPFIQSMRTPENSTWDSTCNSMFTLTKGICLKSDGDGRNDEPVHMRDIKLSQVINMHANAATGLLASKSSTSEVVNPGTKGESLISSHLDVGAPEYDHRALSLLSSSSWGSCGPESVPVHHHPMHENNTIITQQFPMHANANVIPEGVPLEFWPTGWHSTHLHAQLSPTNTNFQLFKAPCESLDFYSNLLN